MNIDWKELAVEIGFLALVAAVSYFILRHRQKVREKEEQDQDGL